MADQPENKIPDAIAVNLTETNKIIGLIAYKGKVELDMDIDLLENLRNRKDRNAYNFFNKQST
jgi:hypothetical protein